MSSETESRLATIEEKVNAGERLPFDDGMFLEEYADVLTLGQLANTVRERKNGNLAFYNTNIHLNPTNVCVYRCVFCAFRSDLKADKAYTFTDDMIRERALEARSQGATEIHVVGGLHHQKPFEWYVNVVRVIHETCPELHIKAWTGVEINWFSHITKKPYKWCLEQLIEAGLGSMPGGGAEIFDEEVRSQICEHKADSQSWIDIHRDAHQLGLRTNATMLYGHVEEAKHRIDHLCKLRELQDKTGGFQTFIPLAFHPDNTGLDHIPKPSGLQDLKTIAISRLMLDNQSVLASQLLNRFSIRTLDLESFGNKQVSNQSSTSQTHPGVVPDIILPVRKGRSTLLDLMHITTQLVTQPLHGVADLFCTATWPPLIHHILPQLKLLVCDW